jgi:glycosyltransferase involved in cell wall biosynthesis
MKPLTIAIDGNEANIKNRVGSNVYAYEVISALAQLTAQDERYSLVILLSSPPIKDLPKPRTGLRYQVVTPQKLWTQFALPLHLFFNRHRYDVFFTPGHYAPRLSSVRYVSSVMDLAYLRYPEQFLKKDLVQLKDWTAYSVKKARKVIAISEATKKDVIQHYGKPGEDVVVAYPAIQPPLPVSKNRLRLALKKYRVTAPYILYVGTLQPRKNLERLIEAYEQLCRKIASHTLKGGRQRSRLPEEPPQLVIAGKIGWMAEGLVERIKSSPFSKNIGMTGYVDEEAKSALIAGAECLVLVGLYEGFGIPPLEAISLGTIPVVSNTSSLPEVVGKAGITVNPENVSSIADGLLEALTLTAKEKAQLRKEGRIQMKKFDWMQTADTILATLEEVAHER